jgi:hypothetical protein
MIEKPPGTIRVPPRFPSSWVILIWPIAGSLTAVKIGSRPFYAPDSTYV